MKYSILVLFLFMSVFATTAQPYEVQNGETFVVNLLTVEEMPDGMIVHSGGEIVLEPQSHLLIGDGSRIVIEDGGKLSGNGGTIGAISSSLGWDGIHVEEGAPSNNLAIELYNAFIIDSDLVGIAVQGNSTIGARRIYCENVLFENNNQHHLYFFGGSMDIPNGSIFKDCTFSTLLTGGSGWPLYLNNTNNITFTGCIFDTLADIMLHFDGTRDLVISFCTFNYPHIGLALHYSVINPLILSNTFTQTAYTGSGKGIEIGFESASAPLVDISIMHNNFHPYPEGAGKAMTVGWLSSSLSNLLITQNTIHSGDFLGFDTGIKVTNANGEDSQVNANAIYGSEFGLWTDGDNSNLSISCNGFDGNQRHIYNTGIIATQMPKGGDPNNKFYNTPGYDIYNDHPTPMIYRLFGLVSNSTTPNVIHNVLFSNAVKKVSCKVDVPGENLDDDDLPKSLIHQTSGIQAEERMDQYSNIETSTLDLYPNPANDYVVVKTNPGTAILILEVYNLNGQLVTSVPTAKNNFTNSINLDQFANGFYYCKVTYVNGDSETKRFVVSK